MEFPLIIAHGEHALYSLIGLIALLVASLAAVICGGVICDRNPIEGSKAGKRLIAIGGYGLVAVAAGGVYMFI